MTVEWVELSDYLAGDMDAAREEALERELFDSYTATSPVVGAFLEVVDAIRVMRARHGTLSCTLTPAALDEIRGHGKLLELHIAAGQTVDCYIPEDTPLCVAHLDIDLHDVQRIDVAFLDAAGEAYFRARDAPLDRRGGRVIVACERHMALFHEVTVFRLLAVERSGERLLGDYAVRNVPLPPH